MYYAQRLGHQAFHELTTVLGVTQKGPFVYVVSYSLQGRGLEPVRLSHPPWVDHLFCSIVLFRIYSISFEPQHSLQYPCHRTASQRLRLVYNLEL